MRAFFGRVDVCVEDDGIRLDLQRTIANAAHHDAYGLLGSTSASTEVERPRTPAEWQGVRFQSNQARDFWPQFEQHNYCWGTWTRTKNNRIRILRVANYTIPHRIRT